MSSLTITAIQAALYWENIPANLDALRRRIENVETPTELVVLPEMFSTGFSMRPEELAEDMNGPTVQWMRQIAVSRKVVLAGSVMTREPPSYFNRLICMLPTGACGYYDKRHLFAYGREDSKYTPGNKRLIASVNGWKVLLLVCYDLRFPVWCRQAMPGEYDLMVVVANWPRQRIYAWRSLLVARAIENQCFVVGVNRVGRDGNDIDYNGNSLVVGPLGEILQDPGEAEEVLTCTLSREQLTATRERFPFWRDADPFKIQL